MTARALLATILTLLTLPALASRERRVPVPDDVPTATILCYHIVESPQDPRMEISRETFRQHMRYLAVTGYNVIPLRHLYEYVTGKRASIPKNAVVITIDDGWRSTYSEVFPEMKRRKWPFTVFVYPKIIGQTAFALSWKQVREMAAAGVDIQSHSYSHPFLTQRKRGLGDKEYAAWLERELTESKRVLERETGRTVEFLAYPYGDYDHRLAENVMRAGYSAALTCDFGRVRRGSDPFRMKRVVIDKKMDFAAFRHYMGADPMRVEEMTPLPGQVFEPVQPLVISAKIPGYKSLDPSSIGMAILSSGTAAPFSYDARDGSISMIISDAVKALKGQYQRALIWATDARTGKRVEATWTFRLPDPNPPVAPASVLQPTAGAPTENGSGAAASSPLTIPASTLPASVPSSVPTSGAGATSELRESREGRVRLQRAPK
jgi:peptidoglycan/xylan/chitin deacetylase (PgdA/CDA1 family)